MHKNNRGFHIIEAIIAVAVIAVIGFIVYRVFVANNSSNQPDSSGQSSEVVWAFDEQNLKWFAKSGNPPACPDPIFERSPIDLSKIQVIGMPGSYRGFSYKPHGGLRLSNPDSGKVDIVMPADATLVGLTRYYEGDPPELQYLLTFETDCGVAFRFDHIYTLTPEFQKIAETTPEPKVNDTRTDPNIKFERTKFKAGDVVATEVGFPRIKNFGFDFGSYDYRNRNEISKNSEWAKIHNQYQALDWFASCWIDQLPSIDAAKAKELAFVIINPAKPNIISDYCTYAPNTTLDFNNGQPTDG